ncbi:hypothetical protein [Salinispira pacifica]
MEEGKVHRNDSRRRGHAAAGALLLLAAGVLSSPFLQSCASAPRAPASEASSAGNSRPTGAAETAAATGTVPSAAERRGAATGFYAGIGGRLSAFLHELERKTESSDWKWIEAHTERSYYRTLIDDLHMKPDEYLRYLFRIGMDYKGRFPFPAPPDQYFPASNIWDVQFVSTHSDGFVTTVYGYLYDRAGHKLDFAVDVLDRIDPMLLTGAYP